MIAMALACQPQILIADEPTTTLDMTIQAQILGQIRGRAGLYSSVLFITHARFGSGKASCEYGHCHVYGPYRGAGAGRGTVPGSQTSLYQLETAECAIPVITKDRKPFNPAIGMVFFLRGGLGVAATGRCPHA